MGGIEAGCVTLPHFYLILKLRPQLDSLSTVCFPDPDQQPATISQLGQEGNFVVGNLVPSVVFPASGGLLIKPSSHDPMSGSANSWEPL